MYLLKLNLFSQGEVVNQDNSISGKDSNAWLGVLVFVVGLYLACTLIANIASLRIVIFAGFSIDAGTLIYPCLLYTSPSPRDPKTSRMPSSA